MKNSTPSNGGELLVVTNIPTPYRLPMYRELRRQLQRLDSDLHVHFLGRGNRARRWTISREDLVGLSVSSPVPVTLEDREESDASGTAVVDHFAQISRMIAERGPRLVVLAWAMDGLALRLLLFCRRHRVRCMVLSGETEETARIRSYPTLRKLLRQPFFRLADGFISYGSQSARYLINRGLPPDRVVTGINVADTSYFREGAEAARHSGEADAFRSGFTRADGSPFRLHLLFVGELFDFKGVVPTIEALASIARSDIVLHVVGSGPYEPAVREAIARTAMTDRVLMHGYRQKPELPLFYAAADALVFPSWGDVFGLVMVEAAATGLPIIASPVSGGTADVVDHGVNGFAVDARDRHEFVEAIERLADDPELRRAMGAASARKAREELTLERSAAAYVRAFAGAQ